MVSRSAFPALSSMTTARPCSSSAVMSIKPAGTCRSFPPDEIRGAIGVCGGVPGDWHENPRYRSARTHVLPIAATDDEWFTREKNLENKSKLAQRAASLDFRFYNSEHRFPRR